MKFIKEILLDHTFIVVSLGSLLFGIISGILGTFSVLRKQSLIGDAISHATLPGICIVFLITGTKSTPLFLIGALITGIVASLIIMLITNKTKIKYDSALGIILSVFFGLGIVLLTYIQKIPNANQAGIDKFLFGQASTLLKIDVKIMGVVAVLIILITTLLWKEFKILCFNREYGLSIGFCMKKIDILLTGLLVLAIVMGLQTVGVILMSSMIIAPAVAARQWTDRLWLMVVLSASFGAISAVGGTLISFFIPKMPTGPIIVVIMSTITFTSVLYKQIKNTGLKQEKQIKRIEEKEHNTEVIAS